ncbi:TPA: hypothetical protein IAC10_06735 [Candidatus Scatousia excrementigallinarum]|uniref:Uncharacterized protein n=1 Tax=Candidatus Scatousia excrementigallinarum TaxID=2840935 RepID=A0A9D1EYL9_9BACT|nr:hypothetical protein [Candidatus Scatousia excrementigallinarum]
MKVNNIISQVQKKIDTKKIINRQNLINRFVNTKGMDSSSEAYREIEKAKGTIANYAQKHAVSVDIFDPSKSIYLDETQQTLKNSLKNNLTVRVSNLLSDKTKEAIIPSDVNKTYIHSKANSRLLANRETGTDYVYTSSTSSEDSFIRMLYRHIAQLTSEVTAKKS